MTPIQRIIISLAILGTGILGIIFVGRWYSLGKLVVLTNSDNSFILVEDEERQIVLERAAKTVNKRLKPGNYVIEVRQADGASKQVVEVKQRQTTAVELSAEPAKQPILMASSPATDINLQPNELFYLEPNIERIYRLSSDQVVAQPFQDLNDLVEVKWLSDISGVARTGSRNAYYFDGQSSRNVALNEHPEDLSSVDTIDTDWLSGKFVFSSDNSVYLVQPPAPAIRMFETEFPAPSLALHDNWLLYFSYPAGYPDLFLEAHDKHGHEPLVSGTKIINLNTKEEFLVTDQETVLAAEWSPDGKKVAYQSLNYINIFDLDSKTTTHRLARNRLIETPSVWLNGNELVYADDSGIWHYQINENISRKLMSIGRLESAADLTLSSDGNQIIFSSNERDKPAIYRIMLAGEPTAIDLKLTNTLPYQTEKFEIKVVNLNKPIVFISTFVPRLNITAEESQSKNQEYRQRALDYLKNQGIDTSNITVRYLSG